MVLQREVLHCATSACGVRGANRRPWHLANFESPYLGVGFGLGLDGGGALLSTGSVWPGRPYLGIISRSFPYLLLI